LRSFSPALGGTLVPLSMWVRISLVYLSRFSPFSASSIKIFIITTAEPTINYHEEWANIHKNRLSGSQKKIGKAAFYQEIFFNGDGIDSLLLYLHGHINSYRLNVLPGGTDLPPSSPPVQMQAQHPHGGRPPRPHCQSHQSPPHYLECNPALLKYLARSTTINTTTTQPII
jgi:hypothetical protein